LISLANANNFSAIYPKEMAEKYPTPNKVTEFIGTGPFRLVEWKPDSYIRMVRYDNYKARSETPSGWGGRKTAYVDELRWIPMPDVATRVAALESGEVDFADDLQAGPATRRSRSEWTRSGWSPIRGSARRSGTRSTSASTSTSR
jgi:peptide/nickel transport system substrate-binding protein